MDDLQKIKFLVLTGNRTTSLGLVGRLVTMSTILTRIHG